MSSHSAFTGSIPRTYHTYLGPLLFEPYARDMARRLNLRPGERGAGERAPRILELACGTGIVTRQLLAALPLDAPPGSLVATDLNDAMLDVARQTATPAGAAGPDPRVTFRQADACSLPFPDASFDTIVCQYGVMFFPDKAKSMREARRVLSPPSPDAPGGRYIFSVWDSLEHNPIPRIIHETIAAIFPNDPPSFLAGAPYGWHDPAVIERTVRTGGEDGSDGGGGGGGFSSCTIAMVRFPHAAPTADDAARAFIEGTPLLAQLADRGVTDPAPIRAAAAAALARELGDNPCRSTMQALVVTAS